MGAWEGGIEGERKRGRERLGEIVMSRCKEGGRGDVRDKDWLTEREKGGTIGLSVGREGDRRKGNGREGRGEGERERRWRGRSEEAPDRRQMNPEQVCTGCPQPYNGCPSRRRQDETD